MYCNKWGHNGAFRPSCYWSIVTGRCPACLYTRILRDKFTCGVAIKCIATNGVIMFYLLLLSLMFLLHLFCFFYIIFWYLLPIQDLTDLEELNLADNLIHYIEDGTFASLSKLKTIDMHNNDLRDISAIYAPYLWILFLEGNMNLHRTKSHVSKLHLFNCLFIQDFFQQSSFIQVNPHRLICFARKPCIEIHIKTYCKTNMFK